ncbi:ABC transporter ATP-binding protein [Actinomadura mexicana]|uniref:Multiple sugar transport system ATP-binding protein n=1 Tax=Actinomadura mexicana TaxID=134959 RepID=A0A238XHN2_9ACTN|nr:ABC transporter ATP-binding protein [Actinomadura mexicana]SNR58081.1 multiple sugar transport system ATP-binding protein [Actinomadura mexicana]
MGSITIRRLTKVYPGAVRALDALDLDVAAGEFFALLGPSGCGKTTLLRTIAGLEAATAGTVRLGDEDVTRLQPGRREVGMVFQDYALFPHMTVMDNIAYPLRVRKQSRAVRYRRAAEAVRELGLQGLERRRPGNLSGGQQQRVALARAVVADPRVLLLDEPLSNLDARLRLEARTYLKRFQHRLGCTTVFVTHDQAEALALADRIAVMQAGQIRQVGTPAEVFRRPVNLFVASFIGSTPMNLLPGTVRGAAVAVGGIELPVPEEARGLVLDGQEVVCGVRPEYMEFSAEPVAGAFGGRVSVVENLGASSLVTLDVDGEAVRVVVGEGFEARYSAEGWALPRPGRVLLYRDGELVTGGGDETGRAAAPLTRDGRSG